MYEVCPVLRTNLFRAAFAAAVGAALFTATPAQAAVIFTFDNASDAQPLSPTQAAGTWYTDRFAPAGFASGLVGGGRTGVLGLSIAAADFQADPFLNTQGRKYDLAAGTLSMFVDLYVPATPVTGRFGGLWATGVNNTNAISAFPIIEYNAGGFRTWNSGWTAIAGFAGVDQWYQIGFTYSSGLLNYFINGQQVSSFAQGTTVSLSNVILQGYNTETNKTIFFDNLTTSAVPEPASMAVFGILGLTAFGYRVRRKVRV